MWDDSHRTSTEYWQKTSDFQKARKSPHSSMAHTHTRERRGQRDLGRTCAPGRERRKRKGFHTPEVSSQRGDQLGQRGCPEEKAVTGLQRPKQRRPAPPGSLQPEPSPAGAGGVGALARASEGRPGGDWGWLGGVSHNRGSTGEAWAPREAGHRCWGQGRRGAGRLRSIFLCRCSQAAGPQGRV